MYKNGIMVLELLARCADYALFHNIKGQYIIAWLPQFDGESVTWCNGTYLPFDCTEEDAVKSYLKKIA